MIKDLDIAKALQQAGPHTAKEVLLDALRLDLQNIARTARAIAQDEPGFADHFRLPDSPSQNALFTAADAMIRELRKPGVAGKFTDNELPEDIVGNLEEDRKAIVAAQDSQASDDAKSVGSTAAIGRLIQAGIKEVNYLNAAIHNKDTRNPDKLRAWESASHTERAPQREKPPEAAPAGSVVAVTA